MANEVELKILSEHRTELPPLPPPEELEGEGFTGFGAAPGASQEPPVDEKFVVTPEHVKTMLWLSYKAGEWKTGYEDIWAVDDSFLQDVADRITPDIQKLPEIANKLIAAGDQKSGWVMFAIDYGRRISMSRMRTRALIAAQQEGEVANG